MSSSPQAPLTARSMTHSECKNAISALTADIKEPPGCHIGSKPLVFMASVSTFGRIHGEITIQIEIRTSSVKYVLYASAGRLMKRRICMVAFPALAQDLQYKVSYAPLVSAV